MEVEVDDVKAKTTYGAPNVNPYGSKKAIYTFKSDTQGICYIQSASMHVNNTGSLAYSVGYNSVVWDAGSRYSGTTPNRIQTGGGFKRSSGFPTTGFKGAQFSLIGSGADQSKYRCKSTDDGTKISLSGGPSAALGEKCTVTYIAGTKGDFTAGSSTPTITMEYHDGSTWTPIDSYTIPVPDRWALGDGATRKYGTQYSLATPGAYPALDYCRGVVTGTAVTPGTTTWAQAAGQTAANKSFRQTYMYRRDELTNSPHANNATNPEGNGITYSANYYSRDVDGTFLGEWGNVYGTYGTGNPWSAHTYYWAAEAWSTGYPFFIDTDGGVLYNYPYYSYIVAVCRGE